MKKKINVFIMFVLEMRLGSSLIIKIGSGYQIVDAAKNGGSAHAHASMSV